MARYILIDKNSGFIFGDSADFKGGIFSGSALEYAKALDESIGNFGRDYDVKPVADCRGGGAGYIVFRADVNGSDAVPVVHDGQDQETIDAVERDCEAICFIEYYIEYYIGCL